MFTGDKGEIFSSVGVEVGFTKGRDTKDAYVQGNGALLCTWTGNALFVNPKVSPLNNNAGYDI